MYFAFVEQDNDIVSGVYILLPGFLSSAASCAFDCCVKMLWCCRHLLPIPSHAFSYILLLLLLSYLLPLLPHHALCLLTCPLHMPCTSYMPFLSLLLSDMHGIFGGWKSDDEGRRRKEWAMERHKQADRALKRTGQRGK